MNTLKVCDCFISFDQSSPSSLSPQLAQALEAARWL